MRGELRLSLAPFARVAMHDALLLHFNIGRTRRGAGHLSRARLSVRFLRSFGRASTASRRRHTSARTSRVTSRTIEFRYGRCRRHTRHPSSYRATSHHTHRAHFHVHSLARDCPRSVPSPAARAYLSRTSRFLHFARARALRRSIARASSSRFSSAKNKVLL